METGLEGQTVDLPLDLAKSLIRDMFVDEVKEEVKKEGAKKDEVPAESSKSELAGTETEKVDDKNKTKTK